MLQKLQFVELFLLIIFVTILYPNLSSQYINIFQVYHDITLIYIHLNYSERLKLLEIIFFYMLFIDF